MIQTQFGMIARAYDDGDIYKVSEVDPVIAKLEAENEKYHQIVADMSNQLRQAAEEIRELKAYQHRILTCEEEE
jgi:hypothetical protein